MTISATTNRIAYAGNGSTTVFSFPYPLFATTDLVALVKTNSTGAESVKTLITDYTVTIAADMQSATITMVVAPASTETFVIYRDVAATQPTDLVESGSLPAESLEDSMDRLALAGQRSRDLAARSLHLAEGYTATFDMTLPKVMTANACVIINPTGDGWTIGPTADQISSAASHVADAQAAATAAAASQAAAATSATAAAGSATSAASSATSASTSATSATSSASSASTSATNAASSATSASGSATTATTQATNAAASATSASGSASAASTSATNAATSATSASTSATNASTSATNAASSATSAAASATSATNAVNAVIFHSVADKTGNYTVVNADAGQFFVVDATSGAVTVTLPQVSAATTVPWTIAVKKYDSSANNVTIAASGTDTIEGSATYTLSAQGAAIWLVPDSSTTPKTWKLMAVGLVNIADHQVTYIKLQNVGATSLIGNPTGSTTTASEITLASTLAFSGTTLGVPAAAIGTTQLATGAVTETILADTVKLRDAELTLDDSVSPPTATAATGFVKGSSTEGQVTELASPGSAVRVQTGGTAYSHRGKRVVFSSSASIGSFAAPTTGKDRKDIVVLQEDGTFAVRTGTAATTGTAVDPTLTVGDIPLARVFLQNTDATVNSADITDLRQRNDIQGTKLLDGSVALSKLAVGVQGDVIYFNGTNWVSLAAGTANRVLKTGGAGANPSWGLPNDLSITSQVQGDIIYFNGTNWVRLGQSTDGKVLRTKGASANPIWDYPAQLNIASQAKGDVVVFDGTNWVRIGVGSNTQVLTADSAQSSGVKWAAASGGTIGVDVQTFTASGTWTKPTNARVSRALMIGAGGGGGSGRRGAAASDRYGGGGGGAGQLFIITIDATQLSATQAATVGAAGTGGTAPGADSTDGNAGGTGGSSVFAGFTAVGGLGGGAGTSAAGGTGAAGRNSIIEGLANGAPSTAGSGSNSTGGNTAASTTSATPCCGGGGGGVNAANTQAGGGFGGGINANVGNGAEVFTSGQSGGSGGTAGGGVGGAGAQTQLYNGTGGGGGGGGTTSGGAGGVGGSYGGGGGGAGGGTNGTTGGAGGAGGGGFVIVVTWCA